MKQLLSTLPIAIISALSIVIFPTSVHASEAQTSCSPIEAVFARGSGSGNAEDNEAVLFKASLISQTKDRGEPFTHVYMLGSESYGGAQYPHVGIFGKLKDNVNGAGAFISGGERFAYGHSVDAGVTEFTEYITTRMNSCPDSSYIVGGYSQGAQVIGESLAKLTSQQLDKITYVGLFGDPKLYLPESNSYEAVSKPRCASEYYDDWNGECVPDSCMGHSLSVWRRAVDDCRTYQGVLNGRESYVPDMIAERVHAWCHKDDGICSDKIFSLGKNHSYTQLSDIPLAVSEALQASGTATKSVIDLDDDTKKYDISFHIPFNCTPLFRFGHAIPTLTFPYEILDQVYKNPKKINIIGETYQDVSNSDDIFYDKVLASRRRPDAIYIRYNIDGRNCLSEYIHMRTSARATIFDTSTTSNRSIATGEPDMTLIKNPIVISDTENRDPCAMTTNTCLVNDSDTESSFASAVMTRPPSVRFSIADYQPTPAVPALLSLVPSKEASYYDQFSWDINGDGDIDYLTTTPTLSYRYKDAIDTTISVTARNSKNGLTTTAQSHVSVGALPSPSVQITNSSHITASKINNSTAHVQWNHAGPDPTEWLIRIDGFPVGRLHGYVRDATLTDLEFDKPMTISIQAVSPNSSTSEPSTVTVEPDSVPTTKNTEVPSVPLPSSFTEPRSPDTLLARSQPQDKFTLLQSSTAAGFKTQVLPLDVQPKQHTTYSIDPSNQTNASFYSAAIPVIGVTAALGYGWYRFRRTHKNHE